MSAVLRLEAFIFLSSSQVHALEIDGPEYCEMNVNESSNSRYQRFEMNNYTSYSFAYLVGIYFEND